MNITKEERYFLESECSKVRKGFFTCFLNPREQRIVESILRKENITYRMFQTFPEAEFSIFYGNKTPEITLLEITSDAQLRHADIMGSLFGLQIEKGTFGDIVLREKSYVFVLSHLKDYMKHSLAQIGRHSVLVKEVSIDMLEQYEKVFEMKKVSISSNRMDAIIAKLANLSRTDAVTLIDKKNVIVNYQILEKHTYDLKQNDVFSMKGYGKYKYLGTEKQSKSGKLVAIFQKYV